MLSVSQYELAEEAARARHPNRIIEAFSPIIFEKLNYPHRVRNTSELWKYLDVMHEAEYLSNRDRSQKILTPQEFIFFKRIALILQEFASEEFQMKAIPWNTLLGTLRLFRHVQLILDPTNKNRILEIGPGCGYMGLILMLAGYPYACTDISQAFYLFQNHLFASIFKDQFQELALGRESVMETIATTQDPMRLHIPWWKYVEMWPEMIPEFDIIVADRVLSEMHPNSLVFLLKTAMKSFRNPSQIKGIVFSNWGYIGDRNISAIIDAFYSCGYAAAVLQSNVSFFATRESAKANGLEILEKHHVEQLFSDTTTFIAGTHKFPFFHNVIQTSQLLQDHSVVSIQEIIDFLAASLGGEEWIHSQDARFLDYVRL
ncbi:MAG: hypothetical protein HQL74_08360 [Magnetococcales bacterium]|nr:hypothetical protein [Magnetococcales bacterium]